MSGLRQRQKDAISKMLSLNASPEEEKKEGFQVPSFLRDSPLTHVQRQ
jgi:hypothetical protein